MKRYHIAKVYRRDNPAMTRGRFREFYQCVSNVFLIELFIHGVFSFEYAFSDRNDFLIFLKDLFDVS